MRTDTILRRLERLEARKPSEESIFNVPPLSDEVMAAALAPAEGLPQEGGLVRTWPIYDPQLPAVQQACDILNAAFRLGYDRIGYQADSNAYRREAFPLMFPEPRPQAVLDMLEAVEGRRVPLLVYTFVEPRDPRGDYQPQTTENGGTAA